MSPCSSWSCFLLALGVAGCRTEPGPPWAPPDAVQAPSVAVAVPGAGLVDASVLPASDLDASRQAADAAAVGVAWPDASTCEFPPAFPAEGATAKQCCHPRVNVEVCRYTKSEIHMHQPGPWTVQVLSVQTDALPGITFPLLRKEHGSMAHPDRIIAQLSYEITTEGLRLAVKRGCYGGEPKSICGEVGLHTWEHGALQTVASPEERKPVARRPTHAD